MKFSPLPATGIAVATVAAISATAVVLKKKKGSKILEPLASFTEKEWDELKDWPAVKTAKSVLEDVVKPAIKEHVLKDEDNSVEITHSPASDVVIGDEPGQIKAFSTEYKEVVERAFKESSADGTVTLELYGKTYGLGARGEKIEDGELPGTVYNAADIAKLHKKLTSK